MNQGMFAHRLLPSLASPGHLPFRIRNVVCLCVRASATPLHKFTGTSLNQEQEVAVRSKDRCVRVVAGPGSGKTLVLTHRIVHEITQNGVSPENILCITFTNKAAGEIRERLKHVVGEEASQKLTVSTFHSFCARLLRKILPSSKPESGLSRDFVIYDESDCQKTLKDVCFKVLDTFASENNKSASDSLILLVNVKVPEDSPVSGKKRAKYKIPPEDLKRGLALVRLAKAYSLEKFIAVKRKKQIPPTPQPVTDHVKNLLKLYEQKVTGNNAADFDDLIGLTIRELHQSPNVRKLFEERWTYVLVDEFQDTDKAQYELVRLLCSNNQNLFVVGDVDQAIYGWRGAESKNMQYALHRDFPSITTFQLRKNYRSSSSILGVASRIITNSLLSRQIGPLEALKLVPVKSWNAPVNVCWLDGPEEECRFVVSEILRTRRNRWSDCAVLYRTHRQSFLLESTLIKAGIPYKLLGAAPLFSHKVIKDLLSYLHFVLNNDDELALQRMINTPPRGIGEKTLFQLNQWASQQDLPLSEALLTKDPSSVGLATKAKASVRSFCELIKSFIEVSEKESVEQLIKSIISQTQFMKYIEDQSEDNEVCAKRCQYVEQFLDSAATAESKYGKGRSALAMFLQDVMLIAEASSSQETSECVSLSTLHASKGMEFNTVFIIGVNRGVIPHEMSDLEEERRLFYVGITRAQEHLYLTHTHGFGATENDVFGRQHEMSAFLKEIIIHEPVTFYPRSWQGDSYR